MNLNTVLLDRDGVINRKVENGYVTKVEELEFINETFEFLTNLSIPDLRIGIITNQQCIAKGLLSSKGLEDIHERVSLEFRKRNISKPEYWICPHFEGTCNCRKPNPLLLKQAMDFFKSEVASTIMIGDSDTDVLAANEVGIEAVHINDKCKKETCTAIFHSYSEFLKYYFHMDKGL